MRTLKGAAWLRAYDDFVDGKNTIGPKINEENDISKYNGQIVLKSETESHHARHDHLMKKIGKIDPYLKIKYSVQEKRHREILNEKLSTCAFFKNGNPPTLSRQPMFAPKKIKALLG